MFFHFFKVFFKRLLTLTLRPVECASSLERTAKHGTVTEDERLK